MTDFYHDIELPGCKIPGNLFLAPIAGYSDAAFRSICTEKGADMCFSEMVSCEGLIYGGTKTFNIMRRAENETHYAIQLFSSKPEAALKAVSSVLKLNPSVIDLNCGCPVPKVIKNGAGSALMKDLILLKEIISALVEGAAASNSPPPVSVKIRSGWDHNSINFIETAAAAAAAGASMISLHPRTRSQGYSGRADWTHIKELKQSLKIPVIGSGDLFSAEAALSMFEQTNCDGIMFSRGAMGNPWIFEQTKALLQNAVMPCPAGDSEKIQTALRHLILAAEFNGEERACREMKKHLCSYTKGISGAAAFRNNIVKAGSLTEYKKILQI